MLLNFSYAGNSLGDLINQVRQHFQQALGGCCSCLSVSPSLSGKAVNDTCQVWGFLAALTFFPGDFAIVSICLNIIFYFESTLDLDVIPKAK